MLLRALLPHALLLTSVPLLALPAQEESPLLPPEVKIQTTEYTEARRGFATHLMHPGPSPQGGDSLTPDGSAQVVSFRSGTLTLAGWMSRVEAGAPKRPAVLFLHGGFAFGPEDWEMTFGFRNAGFIVLVPLLRGENGQSGAFSMFYDEVDDVLAAAEFLARQPGVDANNIFLAGHSVGGTMALLAGMTGRQFRAVASFSGSPDQVLYIRHGVPPRIVPFDTTDSREFEMRSPLAFATSLKAPTRLYYGSRELHWKLSTERLVQVARGAGLDVADVVVEGGHESAVPEEMAGAARFFREQMR